MPSVLNKNLSECYYKKNTICHWERIMKPTSGCVLTQVNLSWHFLAGKQGKNTEWEDFCNVVCRQKVMFADFVKPSGVHRVSPVNTCLHHWRTKHTSTHGPSADRIDFFHPLFSYKHQLTQTNTTTIEQRTSVFGSVSLTRTHAHTHTQLKQKHRMTL